MGDHVFVCYAREDQDFVLPLADNLRRLGVPIWIDQRDILPGANWDRAIDNALYECAIFLIILSKKSVDSQEVQGEYHTALREKKPIIPVLIEECRIPRQLSLYQHVEFTNRNPSDDDKLRQLLQVLGVPVPKLAERELEILRLVNSYRQGERERAGIKLVQFIKENPKIVELPEVLDIIRLGIGDEFSRVRVKFVEAIGLNKTLTLLFHKELKTISKEDKSRGVRDEANKILESFIAVEEPSREAEGDEADLTEHLISGEKTSVEQEITETIGMAKIEGKTALSIDYQVINEPGVETKPFEKFMQKMAKFSQMLPNWMKVGLAGLSFIVLVALVLWWGSEQGYVLFNTETPTIIVTKSYTPSPTNESDPTITPPYTATLTATRTETDTPQPSFTNTYTLTPNEEILFQDNFNDGTADGWKPWGGNWQVVLDEQGNYVYQGDGKDGWAFSSPLDQTVEWKNYSVESKIRVVQIADRNVNQGSDGSISIRGTYIEETQCYKRYELFFDTVGDRVNISRIGGSGPDCPYQEMEDWNYDLEFNHWHTIQIDAINSDISVFVDGFLLFTENDAAFTNGNIQLLAAENGIVQFDDVIVRKLDD